MKCTNTTIGKLLERYLLNRLDDRESELFEGHLFDCPKCRYELQAEELLKALTLKHRRELTLAPLETSVWTNLKTLLESLIVEQLCPAFPLQFRSASAISSGVDQLETVIVNLTGYAGCCPDTPKTGIHGDQLVVSELSPDLTGREVYLLVVQKQEIFTVYPDHDASIQKIADDIGERLMIRRHLDSALSRVISHSFVVRGRIGHNPTLVDGYQSAIFHLSPVAISYLTNPEYMAIVMIR